MSIEINGGHIDIVNGPSKDRLFDACKYAYNGENGNPVVPLEFTMAVVYTNDAAKESPRVYTRTKNLRIVGIDHADDSGDKLNVRGLTKLAFFGDDPATDHDEVWQFSACYDTRTRTGKITG